jgi:hypothetical protein
MYQDLQLGSVDQLAVSTVVGRPPEEVYEFLFDFTRYSKYSDHVENVAIRGDGVGSRFRIALSWWKLGYTLRGVVTDVDPPNRIEWAITRDVDATGHWAIERVDESDLDEVEGLSADAVDSASLARLYLEYDPSSLGSASLGLPPLVSLGRIVDRIRPVAKREAEEIATEAVADVEGSRRPVEVTIETAPGAF